MLVSSEFRVRDRQSRTSPQTSSWSCPAAPFPVRTGAEFSYPAQPGQLHLGQAALAVDAVHDLQVLGVPRYGPQQPVAPGSGLFRVARREQRLQRQGGVAEPAKTVVPVPLAAQFFRQGGGHGRHDSAGRCERQRFQRDQGALHCGPVGPGDSALGSPLPPEFLGGRKDSFRVDRARPGQVARRPSEDERHPVPRADGEVADGPQALAAQRRLGHEVRGIRTGDRMDAVFVVPDPRDDVPVVEAQDQLTAHPDRTADAHHNPHDVRHPVAGRHEVDDLDRPGGGHPFGLQDQGLLAVVPAGCIRRRPPARAASARHWACPAGR